MTGSFENDTAWPESVLLQFQCINPRSSLESRYYGPYNELLHYVAGGNPRYQVAPQTSVVQKGGGAVDFVMWYLVRDLDNRVLLLLEVKDDEHFENAADRLDADAQVRQRFEHLRKEELVNPRVHGISVLGTRMATYVLDTASGELTPTERRRPSISSRVLPRDFIRDFWDKDILSQPGFDEMRRIMADIRLMSP